MSDDPYYFLDQQHTDPKRLRRERDKARQLKKTSWWRNQLSKGICHYCGEHFAPADLTMDHVVPLARGGASTKGNIVPACKNCNAGKKLKTPAEDILDEM